MNSSILRKSILNQLANGFVCFGYIVNLDKESPFLLASQPVILIHLAILPK